MISEFVNTFIASKEELKARIKDNPPESYRGIIDLVIDTIADPEEYSRPDKTRVTEIDDGDYQGTLLYIIGATGYQPSEYWSVKISYGSCSARDTLMSIAENEYNWSEDYSTRTFSEQGIEDIYTLCLHVVQSMKEI